jgi:hypothetical protein
MNLVITGISCYLGTPTEAFAEMLAAQKAPRAAGGSG